MSLAEPDAPKLPGPVKTKLDEIADEYLRNSKNVGLAVAVLSGENTHILCYGTTDRSSGYPITPHSVFEIGSITKAFTGILLAEAMRRGEVQLEDPVNKFLPEEVRIPARGKKTLTLRHLVTHTSGLPRLPDNIDRDVFFTDNPYRTYTVEQLYEFLPRAQVAPGRQHAYSNLGVGLLGHILALAAGSDYESLVRGRILEPLGMTDTSILLSEDQRRRLAQPHDGGRQVSNWDIPTLSGAGALRSTAADMLKFLQANAAPDSSPLREAIERSHQIETRGNPFRQNLGCWLGIALFYLLVDIGARLHVGRYGLKAQIPALIIAFGLPVYLAFKWPRGFATMGLAWFMDRLSGSPHLMTWHNGGTGGYCSFMGFIRETRTGVVALSNSTDSVDSLGSRMLSALQNQS